MLEQMLRVREAQRIWNRNEGIPEFSTICASHFKP